MPKRVISNVGQFDLNMLLTESQRKRAEELIKQAKEKAEKLGTEVAVPGVTKAGEQVTVSPTAPGPAFNLKALLWPIGIGAAMLLGFVLIKKLK